VKEKMRNKLSVSKLVWVVEPDVFGQDYNLPFAAKAVGHNVLEWCDDWWETKRWPELTDKLVIFHGSLNNAARISAELPWNPGAFCDIDWLHCSTYFPIVEKWLLNKCWALTTVKELVNQSECVLSRIGSANSFFVRPDSPLKPFSGRVITRNNLTLEALDYGFYYDDENLPIIISPIKTVSCEWRYIIVDGEVVSGSAYEANGRIAKTDNFNKKSLYYATLIAKQLSVLQKVYIIDICECDGELYLLELNPFSGADLYGCDMSAVVKRISDMVLTK